MHTRTDTVVIGAGQAGLVASHELTGRGVEHVVLEAADRIGGGWHQRWDSFTLVTPGSLVRLPGHPPPCGPGGFLTRDELLRHLETFAASFAVPVRFGVRVEGVAASPGGGFRLETTEGPVRCDRVVVATGSFQHPRVPLFSRGLPGAVHQLHSDAYRSPAALPEGSVLVVGSGQSGAQIADELNGAGREVWLSVSRAERLPRRYRGRDTFDWGWDAGLFEQTPEELDSPADRFGPNPHVSGRDGGRTLDLRRLGRSGVRLVGKVETVRDGRLLLAGDLADNLAGADAFAAGFCEKIDGLIARRGLDAPPPDEPLREDWTPPAPPRELDPVAVGIRTIIWATGYAFDFRWVAAPVLDAFGYPVQRAGATAVPGLHFVGQHFLQRRGSALLCGVATDAAEVAARVAGDPVPAA